MADIGIPEEQIHKWQEIVDLMAEIVQVPAGLIMKVEPPEIAVFVSSQSTGNPYVRGEKAFLNTGLYCERVVGTHRRLLVPNALEDEAWKSNPDIKLGMISYLGFPIEWPNGEIFGTICVLDNKSNGYNELYEKLLRQFCDVIEADLKYLYELREKNKQLIEAERLAALGKIANRVAHNLRNPLAIIGGFARRIYRETPDDDPKRESLGIIIQEVTTLENAVSEIVKVQSLEQELVSRERVIDSPGEKSKSDSK